MTDTNQTPTNTPEQHTVLIDSIGKYLVGMIESIVERKVVQIMESHATITLINHETRDIIEQMVNEKMVEHEHDYDHPSNDDVSDLVATHINHYNFEEMLRGAVEQIMSDGDYATEERVQEMIDEHDFEESVKEVLRNI